MSEQEQKIREFCETMAVRNADYAVAYAVFVLAENINILGEIMESTLDRIASALEDTGEK